MPMLVSGAKPIIPMLVPRGNYFPNDSSRWETIVPNTPSRWLGVYGEIDNNKAGTAAVLGSVSSSGMFGGDCNVPDM